MNYPTYEDYLQSETATRLGIDNTPDEGSEHNIKTVLMPMVNKIIDMACAKWTDPFASDPINSGYRGTKLNAAIPGASSTSAHCHGLAVDLRTSPTVLITDLGEEIERHPEIMGDIDQLIYERGCLHVGLRLGTSRHEVRGDSYTKNADGKIVRTYPLLHTWRPRNA